MSTVRIPVAVKLGSHADPSPKNGGVYTRGRLPGIQLSVLRSAGPEVPGDYVGRCVVDGDGIRAIAGARRARSARSASMSSTWERDPRGGPTVAKTASAPSTLPVRAAMSVLRVITARRASRCRR